VHTFDDSRGVENFGFWIGDQDVAVMEPRPVPVGGAPLNWFDDSRGSSRVERQIAQGGHPRGLTIQGGPARVYRLKPGAAGWDRDSWIA
jgi:hypothetical protein